MNTKNLNITFYISIFLYCAVGCDKRTQFKPEFRDIYIVESNEIDSVCRYEFYLNNKLDHIIEPTDCDSLEFNTNLLDQNNSLGFELISGYLVSSSEYLNGSIIGLELSFHENGKARYINQRNALGDLDGYSYEFNENGELALIYKYSNGSLDGIIFRKLNKGIIEPPNINSTEDSLAWRLKLQK